MKKRLLGIVLSMVCAASLIACGSSSSKYSPTDSAVYDMPATPEMAFEDTTASTTMNGASAGTGATFKDGNADNAKVADSSRKLITRVNLTGETKEFDATVASIRSQVNTLGGYVERSDVSNNSYNAYVNRDASFTVRIPQDKVADFVNSVSGICNITNSSENVEDVTLNYTDTASHIKVLKTEQDNLMKMLEACTEVEDMIAVEERISEVTYQLESYESTIRTYDNLISYSTVDIYISEVKDYSEIIEEPDTVWDRISEGFSGNLKDLKEFFEDLFVFLVVNIPYFIILGIIAVIVWVCVKRYNKKHESDDKTKKYKAPSYIKQEEKVTKEFSDIDDGNNN